MEITNSAIDGGKAFDWGRTSADYAKYRDIYPKEFYDKIIARGFCVKGQKVLDIGTGTGVLPRNMCAYGASWTGADASKEQIAQAKRLSDGKGIEYIASAAEDLDLPAGTFDVITACQCFWYFDHDRLAPKLAEMLKPNGALLILEMAWLPFEDKIAGESEALVLKYNPDWSGAGMVRHEVYVPEQYKRCFKQVFSEEYDLFVPFTRESWNGRMKACRGVGASLPAELLESWEKEHLALLDRIAPPEFEILHSAAWTVLRKI